MTQKTTNKRVLMYIDLLSANHNGVIFSSM